MENKRGKLKEKRGMGKKNFASSGKNTAISRAAS
jgi:hypothetical protein